ncbi:MAG TPA: RsbRD N-terminal domain-containing protein [Pyrinomonadaceae bacterium]|nr:RsbRD N-terminal domain-containing protein [Pyrinomonadaceae bacterium]
MPAELESLCAEMRASVDAITLGWVQRVQQDPYLRSRNRLTLAQIVDHVPQMLEELCGLFGQEGEPDFHAIRAASEHGYVRSAEGYTLTQLLRELELLRDCIFNFVADTEIKRGVNRPDTIQALKLVNKYFGEDIIFVGEHFLKGRTGSNNANA